MLNWDENGAYKEAILGDFKNGDGVRFTLEYRPTCYRRGPYLLLIEIADGPKHHEWGCFDRADQPSRYYHLDTSAYAEAEALAAVLLSDREKHGPLLSTTLSLNPLMARDLVSREVPLDTDWEAMRVTEL